MQRVLEDDNAEDVAKEEQKFRKRDRKVRNTNEVKPNKDNAHEKEVILGGVVPNVPEVHL
jgi:hypothetical protein